MRSLEADVETRCETAPPNQPRLNCEDDRTAARRQRQIDRCDVAGKVWYEPALHQRVRRGRHGLCNRLSVGRFSKRNSRSSGRSVTRANGRNWPREGNAACDL
jgi:hypothetical protein